MCFLATNCLVSKPLPHGLVVVIAETHFNVQIYILAPTSIYPEAETLIKVTLFILIVLSPIPLTWSIYHQIEFEVY